MNTQPLSGMLRVVRNTQPHLGKLMTLLGEEVSKDKHRDTFSVVAVSDDLVTVKVGGLKMFFRPAFDLGGNGYLQGGHYGRSDYPEPFPIVDLTLSVDQLGNVAQQYTIEEAASEVVLWMERVYENMKKLLRDKEVRIVGGVVEVAPGSSR